MQVLLLTLLIRQIAFNIARVISYRVVLSVNKNIIYLRLIATTLFTFLFSIIFFIFVAIDLLFHVVSFGTILASYIVSFIFSFLHFSFEFICKNSITHIEHPLYFFIDNRRCNLLKKTNKKSSLLREIIKDLFPFIGYTSNIGFREIIRCIEVFFIRIILISGVIVLFGAATYENYSVSSLIIIFLIYVPLSVFLALMVSNGASEKIKNYPKLRWMVIAGEFSILLIIIAIVAFVY